MEFLKFSKSSKLNIFAIAIISQCLLICLVLLMLMFADLMLLLDCMLDELFQPSPLLLVAFDVYHAELMLRKILDSNVAYTVIIDET